MVFNSIPFLIFAIVFFLLWNWMNRRNMSRWIFLTAMSFVFYGWWDWRFLFLIIGSGLIDYAAGWLINEKKRSRRLFLIISLIGNLGSLSVFKYSVFFAESLEYLFDSMGMTISLQDKIPEFALILPVGISFYTFQSMSYTIDIYRGRLKPVKNIFHFFSYLSMFPQLVAGPIIRARDLLGQLAEKRISTSLQKWHAIKLIVYGLFQKTVLADNIGDLVNKAYHPANLETGSSFWWWVLVGFSFQIYCDFSGYSLIARGLAKYMGYHFKMNFNHPYLSKSFKNFWQRWHISLSTWFRDYVYIAMGGSRKGLWLGILFMIITMVLSGVWHGAGMTFIIWGFLHGLYLMIERLTNWHKVLIKIPFGWFFSMSIVFLMSMLAWNYFRAESLEQAQQVYWNLFSFHGTEPYFIKYINAFVFLFMAILIELSYLAYNNVLPVKIFYRKANLDIIMVSLAFVACLYLRGPAAEFIYFQF